MASEMSPRGAPSGAASAPPTPGGGGSGRTRTKRMLLDSYYAGVAGTSAPREDPLNIDGVAFDADRYVARLLTQASLQQLLERDKQLQSEIKEMDSDMKMLVYENYNKFISATDTIRNMKQNVATIEKEMEQLTKKMENIMALSGRINTALSGNRDRLEHLTSAHRLLKRLQFVVALPARLRKCVEMGSYVEAVQYYSKTRALIQKNNHLPSFARIQTECSDIMDSLKKILRQRMVVKAPEKPSAKWMPPRREVDEAAKLLLDLQEPEDAVREALFASHRAAFDAVYRRANEADTSMSAEDFFIQLLFSFESYKTLFIGDVVIDDEIVIEGPAWMHLQKFLNEIVDHYMRFVQKRVFARNAQSQQAVSAKEVISALADVHAKLSQVGRQLPFLRMAERSNDMVGGILVNYVENMFAKLTTESQAKMKSLQELAEGKGPITGKDLEKYWENVGDTFATEIVTSLESVLENLTPLVESEQKFVQAQSARVAPKVHIKTQQFLLCVEHDILQHISAVENPNDRKAVTINPVLILALSLVSRKLCGQLERLIDTVQKVYQTELQVINAEDLRRRFQDMSSSLLGVFISYHSNSVSSFLRSYIGLANWLTSREPREVGMGAQSFVTGIKEADVQARLFYPDQAMSASDSRRAQTSRSYSPERNYTSPALPQTELTRAGITAQIIRTGLKSMHELVRLCTLSHSGMHQLQVDKYFISLSLSPLVAGSPAAREVEGLIENIETALQQRCVDERDREIGSMPQTIAMKILQPLFPNLPAASSL